MPDDGRPSRSPTLSFYEYCELLNVDRPDLPDDLKITPLVYKTQQERTQIMLQLSKVQNHFNRYLQVGGFPELALADNDILAQQVMREDVVDKVLKRDLPSFTRSAMQQSWSESSCISATFLPRSFLSRQLRRN